MYRLVVGEIGNEQGHIIPCKATTLHGARSALGQQLARYGAGQGWGRVEEYDAPQDEERGGGWKQREPAEGELEATVALLAKALYAEEVPHAS